MAVEARVRAQVAREMPGAELQFERRGEPQTLDRALGFLVD